MHIRNKYHFLRLQTCQPWQAETLGSRLCCSNCSRPRHAHFRVGIVAMKRHPSNRALPVQLGP